MQLNFNGISSKVLSIIGMLILLLAIMTNHWRKKDIGGNPVHESVWDDCAIAKLGSSCHLSKAEQDLLSGVQALLLLAAVFEFSNLLISGFIYCLKTALKPFLITIETCSATFGMAAVIIYLHKFIVKAGWHLDWSWILAVVGATLITVGDMQSIVHFVKTKRAKASEKLKKYLPMAMEPAEASTIV